MKILDRRLFLLRKRRRDWLVWQVCIPVFFILITGIRYIRVHEWAFEKSFGGGDLILYSIMLLIGVTIELSSIRAADSKLQTDEHLEKAALCAQVCAVLMLFFYAPIRFDFMGCNLSTGGTDEIWRMFVYGWFSIGCAVFAIGLSSNLLWRTFGDLLESSGGQTNV